MTTFKEAPLTVSAEYGENQNPLNAELILVSAPGAVGKSTLARQIAYSTGAIYIDLSEAEPVGGNTISGGLVRSNIYREWEQGNVAFVIDGLDEARLRATQEAISAFLGDLVAISRGKRSPTVLFGRTGSIQDAWLSLLDRESDVSNVSVLEIGYFDRETSIEFAKIKLFHDTGAITAPQEEAIGLLIDRLRQQTIREEGRFTGYAPVLCAVAERVSQESNPAALISKISQGNENITVERISSAIIERERGKLSSLRFSAPQVGESLYLKAEQLNRIVAHVYGLPKPPLPALSSQDAATYEAALDTWVAEHPFLRGNERPSSAVFEAMICAHALQSSASSRAALDRELGKGGTANPFLFDFYLASKDASGEIFISPEHIGIIYSSIRANLAIGETASLVVEAEEDAVEEEIYRANVDISIISKLSDGPKVFTFKTEQVGTLLLGQNVENVYINAPYAKVSIGNGLEAHLIAPISIQCESFEVNASRLVVEAQNAQDSQSGNSIFIESQTANASKMGSAPYVKSGTNFSVTWEGSNTYPWTRYSTAPKTTKNQKLDEALRRFRKIIISFRSHSKGSLARYRAKIDHERTTKGEGQRVLDALISENIIYQEGVMYRLNPQLLYDITGALYHECNSRQFSEKTIEYVDKIISSPCCR
jgi:hypothetical protein